MKRQIRIEYLAAALLGLSAAGGAVAQTAPARATEPLPPTATEIPEPGHFGLFLIGVAGLVIGRWTSRARKKRAE